MRKKIRLLAMILLVSAGSLYAEKRSEAFYQKIAAEACSGKTEVRMADGSRCDIVTEHYAIFRFLYG